MQLSVPDMSCDHCRKAITSAIEARGGQVEVDLDSRKITVTGLESAAAIATLGEIGFSATVVE